MKCRVCSAPTTEWLDLGMQPLANELHAYANASVETFPLQVERCPQCGLSQLSTVVSPERLFEVNYPYRSGVSRTWMAHLRELLISIQPGSLLDIGANDGSLVNLARSFDMPAFGIDPAPQGLGVMKGSFPRDTAGFTSDSFRTITALNVLGHVDDVHAFVAEVARLLAPNGTFIIEVPYLGSLMYNTAFDTIYHEHLSYWSGTALWRLLDDHGMGVTAWELMPDIHGGSIRVRASKGRASVSGPFDLGLLQPEIYAAFRESVKERIDYFWQQYREGGRWAAFGAAAKGSVFCTAAGIGPDQLRYVVDETPAKQGKFTPYNVRILPLHALYADPVDKLLCLPWNFRTEILEIIDGLNLGIEVIVS